MNATSPKYRRGGRGSHQLGVGPDEQCAVYHSRHGSLSSKKSKTNINSMQLHACIRFLTSYYATVNIDDNPSSTGVVVFPYKRIIFIIVGYIR